MKIPAVIMLALALSGCAATHHASRRAVPQTSLEEDAAMGPAAQAKLYLSVVEGLIRQERYQAAIAFLAKYQKSGAVTPRFRKLTADALCGAGRYDEAIAGYRALLNTDYAAAAHAGMARAQSAQGNWAAAEESFRQAAVLDPANASYLNNLGFARLRQNLNGPALYPAVEVLRRAYELQPDSPLILDNLAMAEARAGRQAQLAALLQTIPDNDRRNQVARLATGGNNTVAPTISAAVPAVPAVKGKKK